MPCDFYFDNFFVYADLVDDGDKLTTLGSQLKEKENSVEDFKPWNGEIELLESMLNEQDSIQERKPQFLNWGLQNEDEQLKECETVLSHVKELVISTDGREELACLNSQEKTVRQTFAAATTIENQSFTLIEDENAALEELDVISRINQEEGRQLLKIAKAEEEEHAEFKL